MVSQKEIRSRIKTIADEIKFAKEKAQKPCVLILGAGASISSGIPTTKKIVEEILKSRAPNLQEGTLWDRFDEFWSSLPANDREQTMKPYLEKRPSSGYAHLAELIKQGYFTPIITLNFDRLLVTALIANGQQDHKDFAVLIRNEVRNDDAVIQAIVDMKDPPVKVLQMHAGLGSQGTLLFNRAEMHEYPVGINQLLRNLTKDNILAVGCSFKDLNIASAFSSQGGRVYCVNPEGIPENLVHPVLLRHSQQFVIDGDYGKFDKFFEALHEDLKALSEPPVPREKPKFNPFKFLENYGPNDRDMLYEREVEEKEVMKCLFGKTRQMVIHVVGPAKAGKTSFVRARLLPGFDKKRALSVYLRCPVVPVGKLEEWLPEKLAGPKRRPTDKQPTARFTASLGDTIKKLAKDANQEGKQVVVVLDDFDRLLAKDAETDRATKDAETDRATKDAETDRATKDAETDRATLVLLADLAGACEDKNLRFLCVGTYEMPYMRAVDKAHQQRCWVDALEKNQVATIIRKLAARADIQFDEEVIEEIISEYAPSKDDEQHPFTMAHVQALCHLLADRKKIDIKYYREIMDKQGRGLNAALNVKEFFSSLEDLPDEGRNLLRKVVKFIEGDSKQHIARCVQEHRMDLLAA